MDCNSPGALTRIIDGKVRSTEILHHLKKEVEYFQEYYGKRIKLSIVLVGSNTASEIYVRNKMKAAACVGIAVDLIRFHDSIPSDELLIRIKELNEDKDVSGIIVQMPLPDHIDENQIINTISPIKDVDGFTLQNVGALYSGCSKSSGVPYDTSKPIGCGIGGKVRGYHIACTARGVLDLILSVQTDITSKHVVVIGRSNIVGKPLAALLLQNDCTVTIAHSKTRLLKSLTDTADIVISAVGKANAFTREYFSQNAIVIDVGMNRLGVNGPTRNKIVGDVDFEDVFGHVAALTPVPGGVGPMTVAYLLVNCFRAALMTLSD